jgi:hypothetical protein
VEGDVDGSASVLIAMSSLTLRTPVRYVTACSPAVRELAAAELRACLEVNVVGTWLACRAAVTPMCEAGHGSILTLASALRLVGAAGRSGYAASKGAVVQLTAGIRLHHRHRPSRRRWLDEPLTFDLVDERHGITLGGGSVVPGRDWRSGGVPPGSGPSAVAG